MFHPGDDIVLRPFVAAPPARWAGLPETVRQTCDHVDPLADGDAPFCLAMNRANCLAYDGTATPGTTRGALGMPLWVMLDCCLLTSVMVGFSAPADALPGSLRATLDPEGELEHIGIVSFASASDLRLESSDRVTAAAFADEVAGFGALYASPRTPQVVVILGDRYDALPAATTLDLFGSVPLVSRLSLVARVENLFDEAVITRNQGGSMDLGAPRTVWLGLRWGY